MNLRQSAAAVVPVATAGERWEVTPEERGERMGGRERGGLFLFLDFFAVFPEDFLFLVWIVSLHRVSGRLYCREGERGGGEKQEGERERERARTLTS